MSRAVRIEYEGAFYHVMARGVARLPTFLDDEDRRIFLLRTPRAGLARWMRHVNGDYVRAFNFRHRRVGPLWQGRYKAILVGEARYLKECSRYIHLNPNRAKYRAYVEAGKGQKAVSPFDRAAAGLARHTCGGRRSSRGCGNGRRG